MPSIVTHHLFAKDVLNQTTKTIQTKIQNSLDIYDIFAQSFDNLFYYNLFSLKKGSNIRKKGIILQQIHTDEYFLNIIENIKTKKLENNSDVISYLYSSLTHYVLDSIFHPFIIYQAGIYEKIKKSTYKYRGNHEEIEVTFDAILYEKRFKKPLYKEQIANDLLPNIILSKELKEVIDETFKKTFQLTNMDKIFEKSIKQGNFILKYFVTDKTGVKKFCYKIFDFIFYKNNMKYQALSFHVKEKKLEFLNNSHETWYYPTNKKIQKKENFDELYQNALNLAINLFNTTEKYLNNKINKAEYQKILEKNSYATGLDWTENKQFLYFKD